MWVVLVINWLIKNVAERLLVVMNLNTLGFSNSSKYIVLLFYNQNNY
jgi:hypothetical protein